MGVSYSTPLSKTQPRTLGTLPPRDSCPEPPLRCGVRGPRHSGAAGNGPTELPERASRGSQAREAPQPGSSGTRGEGAGGGAGSGGGDLTPPSLPPALPSPSSRAHARPAPPPPCRLRRNISRLRRRARAAGPRPACAEAGRAA